MEDLRKLRSGNSSGSMSNNFVKPSYGNVTNYQAQRSNNHVAPVANGYGTSTDTGMSSLATNMASMSFGGLASYPNGGKTTSNVHQGLHQAGSEYSQLGAMAPGVAQAYLINGQIVFGPPPGSANQLGNHAATTMPGGPGIFATSGAPYLSQDGYSWQYFDNTSPSQGWSNSRLPSSSTDVPSLVTPRRDSDSSNEHEGPGTPYNDFTPYGHQGVAVVGHSPESALTWTPSPSQPGYAAKQQKAGIPPMPADISKLLAQEPAIPKAVPAPYSPTKPLDRALENPHGNTNVYIRGLQPDTTDEMLVAYAKRFGDIVSSKAIIDHSSGLCKGFGFVKYHNYEDAGRCIRGFFYRGYESSFARESFYSQLKKLQDETMTNLYVSNLPKEMNEHELAMFFGQYKVCSARILRHPDGSGRGVGFARFEDRATCEEVIKKYNNTPVGVKTEEEEEQLIQIRYADTPEQKALKQQTTAARQYRTAEYESQTNPRGNMSNGRPSANASAAAPTDGDFETYLTGTAGSGRYLAPSSLAGRRLGHLNSQIGSAYSEHSSAPAISVPQKAQAPLGDTKGSGEQPPTVAETSVASTA